MDEPWGSCKFVEQIREWFAEKVFSEYAETKSFLDAIQAGDAGRAQDSLHALMRSMISYFDAADREIFYQGLILGLLRRNAMWMIRSTQETGDGRCDIIIRSQERKLGYIIELKYSNDIDDPEKDAASGLRQIIDKRYADGFINGGIKDVKLFGIAFHKKWCSVVEKPY
ncbi:MAG: PD-(D/E)XK nuclease domain-containing protein [Oscillospiraceae bacterium]|jgi:hypothetical protein|nr:PD-(D/E)XK nuclease domain-containing protein [Oscillospiraceae bacterium]